MILQPNQRGEDYISGFEARVGEKAKDNQPNLLEAREAAGVA